MTSRRDCMLNVLSGQQCDAVPAAPLVGFHSARLFNVPIETAARDGSLMGDLQLKTADFYGLYAAFNFMDLSLEPEAMGASISWKDIPTVQNQLPFAEADKHLDTIGDDFVSRGRLPTNLNAIRQMKQGNSDMVVGGYLSGPLTFLSQSFGITALFGESRKNLNHLGELTRKATKILESYADSLISAGADVLMILEPVAALLSPKVFEAAGVGNISELIRGIGSRGTNAILHVCGDSNHILTQMISTKPAAVSIDIQVGIDAPANIDSNIVVLGNVGTVELLRLSPDGISDLSRSTLDKTGGRKHILSSACDVSVNTPVENVKAMMSVAGNWKLS